MLRFSFETSIGRLRVETDWPALAEFLLQRKHLNPPAEHREVTVSVMLDNPADMEGNDSPEARPRLVRLPDSAFLVDRASIQGMVHPDSAFKGTILEWVWYALAICCAPDGWEAIHASAAERDGTAFVVSGESGVGKTGALLDMLTSGMRFLTDDILLVNGSGMVRGWDTSLHLWPDQARGLGRGTETLDFAGKVRVKIDHVAQGQEYRAGARRVEGPAHVGPGFDSEWRPRAGTAGLRVAIVNRAHTGTQRWFGGDVIHAFGIVRGLRALGLSASLHDCEWDDYGNCDIVQVMHAQYQWSAMAAERAMAAGKPVVVSAITHTRPAAEDLWQAISSADKVLCYSEAEAAFYRERFPEEVEGKFVAVPMGVRQEALEPTSITSDRTVFSAGAYDEAKGHHMTLRACIKLKVPVTFAGPLDRPASPYYLGLLRKEAGDWNGVRFFGLMEGDDLWHQYRQAHVHVDAAEMEPFGLTTLEALACGCNIVHPRDSWAAEQFGRVGSLCDTTDLDALCKAIEVELNKPRGWHGYRPITDTEAAKALLPVYQEVLT